MWRRFHFVEYLYQRIAPILKIIRYEKVTAYYNKKFGKVVRGH